jgi:hypothetical protein
MSYLLALDPEDEEYDSYAAIRERALARMPTVLAVLPPEPTLRKLPAPAPIEHKPEYVPVKGPFGRKYIAVKGPFGVTRCPPRFWVCDAGPPKIADALRSSRDCRRAATGAPTSMTMTAASTDVYTRRSCAVWRFRYRSRTAASWAASGAP